MSMVDVSGKPDVIREAIAEGFIKLSNNTLEVLKKNDRNVEKGNVYETARIAGILAAKRTRELLPHCHPVRVSKVSVELFIENDGVRARCYVKAVDRTGVEMDALTGVTIALLTVRDMVKKLEKDERGLYPNVEITGVKVVEKIKRTQ